MTIQKLSIQNLLLVGFTLFSMFFGAGNLIFPPDLAARAGAQVIPAMAGFLISAVGLPVLGVAAVAVSGGLEKLAGKVGGRFSLLFTLTAYLAIGPFLAIPRTASTSFEMTLLPVLSGAGVQLGDYLGHTDMTVQFWAQLGCVFCHCPSFVRSSGNPFRTFGQGDLSGTVDPDCSIIYGKADLAHGGGGRDSGRICGRSFGERLYGRVSDHGYACGFKFWHYHFS